MAASGEIRPLDIGTPRDTIWPYADIGQRAVETVRFAVYDARQMRTLAIILLLAGVGFLIYGAMTPNNPPDLIVSGAILMIALPVCFGVGLLLLLISLLAPKRP